MKKLLAIIILSLSIFGGYNSVLANDLTCSDDKNSHVIKIFYNQDRIAVSYTHLRAHET